jgi:hypothetical protein
MTASEHRPHSSPREDQPPAHATRDSRGRFAPGKPGGPGNPFERHGAALRVANSANERFAFTSRHAGGCNFLRCNRGVWFITNGISADPSQLRSADPTNPANTTNYTLQLLMGPVDGRPVDTTGIN